MEIPGLFQTFAEISVAIAGFSGLIVSLRKDVGPLRGVQKFRLRLLLYLSLGAMFLSLLPELLVVIGVEGQRLWQIGAWAAIACSVSFLLWWILATLQVYKVEPEIINRLAMSIMTLGHLTALLLMLVSLLGWSRLGVDAAFTITLAWYLVHAAQQFIRMLFIPTRSDLAQAKREQASGESIE